MPLIAFTSDLHGNIDFYEEFLRLARQRAVQAAIIGGDLFPHTSSRSEAIAQQRRFISNQLRPLLETHRADGGPPVYAILGNDDWFAALDELKALERLGLLIEFHLRALALDDQISIAGYACVPLTPFSIKDWERPEQDDSRPYTFVHALHSREGSITALSEAQFHAQPTIGEELAKLAQQSDPSRTIYICHGPPYDTGFDRTRLGRSVGSRDLRRFIESRQPPLTLHGHIHEGPEMCGSYTARIGRTWCINPGQGGRLHAIVVDLYDLPRSLSHTQL